MRVIHGCYSVIATFIFLGVILIYYILNIAVHVVSHQGKHNIQHCPQLVAHSNIRRLKLLIICVPGWDQLGVHVFTYTFLNKGNTLTDTL